VLKGKKILITGLTGNLGGTMAEALVKDNELWGLARYSREGQLEYWKKAGVHPFVGDYATSDLSALPDDFDYVIHSAAAANQVRAAAFEQAMRDNADGVGVLMYHCRKAKAFLHVSTIGVCAPKGDNDELYREDDVCGSSAMGHYTGSKLAGEGAARAFSLALNIPTIICRMCVQYGATKEGGLPGIVLKMLLQGRPIPLRKGWTNINALISNDDVVRFIEPSLKAAAVPAVTINWGGDVNVPQTEVIEYLAKLAGVAPKWERVDEGGWPSFPIDPSKRKAITGPCQVEWRDGLKNMYDAIHERLRAEIAKAA
jgi:UDP-glucuronate 4-epimerase